MNKFIDSKFFQASKILHLKMINFKGDHVNVLMMTVVFILSNCASADVIQCVRAMVSTFGNLTDPLLCAKFSILNLRLNDEPALSEDVIEYYKKFYDQLGADKIKLRHQFCDKRITFSICMKELKEFGNNQEKILKNALYYHKQTAELYGNRTIHTSGTYSFHYLSHISDVVSIVVQNMKTPEGFCTDKYNPRNPPTAEEP